MFFSEPGIYISPIDYSNNKNINEIIIIIVLTKHNNCDGENNDVGNNRETVTELSPFSCQIFPVDCQKILGQTVLYPNYICSSFFLSQVFNIAIKQLLKIINKNKQEK